MSRKSRVEEYKLLSAMRKLRYKRDQVWEGYLTPAEAQAFHALPDVELVNDNVASYILDYVNRGLGHGLYCSFVVTSRTLIEQLRQMEEDRQLGKEIRRKNT